MDVASPLTKAGGLAFEVVLKPANTDSPPAILVGSPSKERSISQELIEKKLKDAEERRQSVEAIRLKSVVRDRERLQDATQRVQELNSSFTKETEKKLMEKMATQEEKRKAQLNALQQRLSEHESHAEQVRMKKLNKSVSDEKENSD